jgi:hypothetical protein
LAPGDILFNNTNSPALVGKTTLNAHSLAAGRYKPQVAEQAPENEPAELTREVLTIDSEIVEDLEKSLKEVEA